MPAMSALAMFFQLLVAPCQLVVVLWNACIVFLQVMRSVMQEAKQEAAEVMALLDGDVSVMDTNASTSLLLDAPNPWQMLIIARASSFAFLLRLSKHRVLHLEVDEKFIATKLEVIRTELALHIEHVPRLLQTPAETHDTRTIRYAPVKAPYLWREDAIATAAAVPLANTGSEERSHRKKYVELLTESTLRRQLHLDQLARVGQEVAPKRGLAKMHGENVAKRKALANATNMQAEVSVDADGAQMERNIHAALSENLSIPNAVVLQARRRKRGLYAQSSEFSLVPKT